MSQIVTAVYEDGVLKPTVPLDLASGSTVVVTVQPSTEQRKPRAEQLLAQLETLRKTFPIHSGGERLTREELHERD